MATAMKYDRQEAIEKATELFWEKGFHATSMRNLQDVLDMRPGSIYAGFGSKEGLFLEALHFYTDQGLQNLASAEATMASPLEALKSSLRNAVTQSAALPSGVCMLVKSVSELTEDNAELLAEAKRLLVKMQDAFTDLLVKAQECGELDKAKDPRRLARFFQMQVIGIRVFSHATDNQSKVEELLDDAFACLN